MRPRIRLALGLGLAALAALSGCQQWMTTQPKRRALGTAPFFGDDSEARSLPAGVLPMGPVRSGDPFYSGMRHGAPIARIPEPITGALLERGQQRYQIFCAPCHGLTGQADGLIVQRGFPRPPSYHSDRLRSAPAGHFFWVMTDGWGAMFPYAQRLSPADRWAIAAYLRALQLSWHAPLSAVPPDIRARLLAQRAR